MSRTVVVATHNEGKLVEIRRILDLGLGAASQQVELVSAGALHLPDPVETGVSFDDNALLKARDVAGRTGLPAVADDSGLIVDILGCAPGILSARWSGVHGDDAANNRLLLAQISDIPDRSRTARFRCAAALVLPSAWLKAEGVDAQRFTMADAAWQAAPEGGLELGGLEMVRHGDMTGVIIHEPRGEHGFGYDPIFVPNEQPSRSAHAGTLLTSAEMTADEKNAISHRSKAFSALVPAITKLLD